MILSDRLQYLATDMGADLFSISYVGNAVDPDLVSLPNCITVGVHLSDFLISGITEGPTYTYFQHYRTVNTLIDQITTRLVIELQRNGYMACAIPASQSVKDRPGEYRGVFPHKTGAVHGGLGWIGRNGLLITEQYGPSVRLGSVLTNAPFEEAVDRSNEMAKLAEKYCGDCFLCKENCPSGAIQGGLWQPGVPRDELVNADTCSRHMTKAYGHIGRGSVCGRCIAVCPFANTKV